MGSTKGLGDECSSSLGLQPEMLKGRSAKPPASTKSSSHSHGELTGAWELLSPGEKQNKAPTKKNKEKESVRCVRALCFSQQPGALASQHGCRGFSCCTSPARTPSFLKMPKTIPQRCTLMPRDAAVQGQACTETSGCRRILRGCCR